MRHLVDQLRCLGSGAVLGEWWLERAVHIGKEYAKGTTLEPEKVIMNKLTLHSAATKARAHHPDSCRLAEDMAAGPARHPAPPAEPGTAQLGGKLTRKAHEEVVEAIAQRLGSHLFANAGEYSNSGWPDGTLEGGVEGMEAEEAMALACQQLHAQGLLIVEMYDRVTLSAGDRVVRRGGGSGGSISDHSWVYISYHQVDHNCQPYPVTRCVARVEHICRVSIGGVGTFPRDILQQAGLQEQARVDNRGLRADALPLRLALVHMWRAEACTAAAHGTVGCRETDDVVTGELPDLLLVSNTSRKANNMLQDTPETLTSLPRGGRRYYGQWLCDVNEFQTQLVATNKLEMSRRKSQKAAGGMRRGRYFMTSHRSTQIDCD